MRDDKLELPSEKSSVSRLGSKGYHLKVTGNIMIQLNYLIIMIIIMIMIIIRKVVMSKCKHLTW